MISAELILKKQGTSLSVWDLVRDRHTFHGGEQDYLEPMSTRFCYPPACRGVRKFIVPQPKSVRKAAPIVVPGLSLKTTAFTRSLATDIVVNPVPHEPYMLSFKQRLRSLMGKFSPVTTRVSDVEAMALTGLFWGSEKLSCFWCSCEVSIDTVDPAEDHMQSAPHCPFMRSMAVRKHTDAEREKAIESMLNSVSVTNILLTATVSEAGKALREIMEEVFDRRYASPHTQELLRLISQKLLANRKSKKATNPRFTCCCCVDNQIDVALLPCGHLCVCVYCSGYVQRCPVCRAPIHARHLVHLE